MIVGGSAASGTINKWKKRHAQMVMVVELVTKKPNEQVPAITFNQTGLEDVHYPYDDVLIVTLNVHGNKVKW